MKVQFLLSEEAQKECFIQTGSKPGYQITTEVDVTQLTKEERAVLYQYVVRELMDLSQADVIAESIQGQDLLYQKKRFKSSFLDGISGIRQFLAELSMAESRKAQQEREWYEAEHYKKRHHEGFVDAAIGSRVAEYYQVQFNELMDRTEKAQQAYEAIPPAERKMISIASAGEYDFERAGLRAWWKAYNDGVSAEMEKARQARAEQEELAWQEMEAWGKAQGSELLKARIRNGLNWKKLALMEHIQSALNNILCFKCEYEALEGSEDRQLGNPGLKMIEKMERARKVLPDWATISLRRIDLEDEEEAFDYHNVVGQIGSTKVDLVFT
jgi:hypothetical protein